MATSLQLCQDKLKTIKFNVITTCPDYTRQKCKMHIEHNTTL